MRSLSFTINGNAVKGASTFDVINPATEQVLDKAPEASAEQVDMAVNSAHAAFQEWRKLSFEQRSVVCQKAGRVIADNIEEIAEILTLEQGKPLAAALSEVETAIERLEASSDLRPKPEVLKDDAETRVVVHRKPLGVVAVITPWNYPVSIAVGRMTSALMAGNTVVLKPSPYTPLATLLVGMLLKDVFPPGVINVISGGDSVGELLTRHPLVRKISFTGSVPTGKAIAAVAAKDLKHVTLELGGNDAAIVLEDADVDQMAEDIFWGAFKNSGQICIAIKRLYVHEQVYEPLVAKLKELAENVIIGDGFDPEVAMGPLNNKAQLEIVTELVEDAKAQGATIVTGGHRLDRPGYFYAPTIITDVQEGVRIVDEEQFGPVLPVMKFSNVDEAIERANRTKMGLGGSVWGRDIDNAAKIASQLESGVAWVNCASKLAPYAPFGGVKESGIGREMGRWGYVELTDAQTLNIKK